MAALALVAAAVLAGVTADLPVGEARCGETTCAPDTYCSPYDYHCRPCSDLCNSRHRNYAKDTCEEHCQAYIHDQRYVQRKEDIIEQLTRKVQTLTIVSSVALIIGAVLSLAAVLYASRFLRAHRHLLWSFTKRSATYGGKQKVGTAAEDPEAGRKGAAAAAAAAALQLPGGNAGAGAGTNANGGNGGVSPPTPSPAALSRSVSRDVATPATTSTPLSRPRHPSEDTTLEFAYDNPALVPSPSPTADQHPTTLTSTAPSAVTPGLGGRKESSF